MISSTIQLWDLPLRVFHWLLVIAIIAAYVTSELGGQWLPWHVHSGVFVIALIVFRIFWGFLGSFYSRFSSFPVSIANLRAFINSQWSEPGHNPLGAISIYAIIFTILIQSSCGLFAAIDESDFSGPLYELVNARIAEFMTSWHASLFDLLLSLIALHLLAISYYFFAKNKNIVTPMITGRVKSNAPDFDQKYFSFKKAHLTICLLIALFTIWLLESGVLMLLSTNHTVNQNNLTTPIW